jgi:hypothetical protein
MNRRQQNKGRLPPFVPMIKEVIAAPAWSTMSHEARSLYLALSARYNAIADNNGRIFLSTRQAAKEIGSGLEEVRNWFRELQHYGFIAMTEPGYLGTNGKGRAPHWRITVFSCKNDPPTKDFLKWDGTKFQRRTRSSRKTESRVAFHTYPESEMRLTPVSEMPLSSRQK